ncbi:MAG: tRNA (adenosine(37)-N6)-threonylcarbamoyltransferase complex transferase subunit TsaD [Clostridiales bacterium]|nr:tRNA (adenosine(37)-N6)-threonylcarbamoyltransferase complex transferase subunit TsaD [Clostridiales bacterium]
MKDCSLVVLGIETSCDETAAAVVKDGGETLSNIISSQIDVHRVYGGVVPEIASRKHIESIGYVVGEAIKSAGVEKHDIDAVAATCGPGLVGALIVGLSYGKALSYGLRKPLIGVNHIEGHICANYLDNSKFEPPFMCLVVSGGHTHLIKVIDYGVYEIIGRTRDDAAGEAFDKTARALGLSYPGGPAIEAAAKSGDPRSVALPRASIAGSPYDFSFSGLKSAVLNCINKSKMMGDPVSAEDMAASFQSAVVDALAGKLIHACEEHGMSKVALAGGVASNSALRSAVKDACLARGYELHMPSPICCTDNAAMIASCGYFHLKQGKISSLDLNANPNLPLCSLD